MTDDVLIVLQQQVVRKLRQFLDLIDQRVVEAVDVVLIHPLRRVFGDLEALLERLQQRHAGAVHHVRAVGRRQSEEAEQPLVQDQLVAEPEVGPCLFSFSHALRRSTEFVDHS